MRWGSALHADAQSERKPPVEFSQQADDYPTGDSPISWPTLRVHFLPAGRIPRCRRRGGYRCQVGRMTLSQRTETFDVMTS